MGRLAHKSMHKNNKAGKKAFRLKRKTKDIDQVVEDFRPKNLEKITQGVGEEEEEDEEEDKDEDEEEEEVERSDSLD
eukprot:UC1_evm5s502